MSLLPLVGRKVLYAVLASGSVISGFLALLGFFGALSTFINPPPSMGLLQRLGFLLMIAGCAACVVGTVVGFMAIFSLPVREPKRRLWLSWGLAAGIVPATIMFFAMLGDGDEGASVYLLGMPAAVGLAVLTELWWPVFGTFSKPE